VKTIKCQKYFFINVLKTGPGTGQCDQFNREPAFVPVWMTLLNR
jgi:hypothetical protein